MTRHDAEKHQRENLSLLAQLCFMRRHGERQGDGDVRRAGKRRRHRCAMMHAHAARRVAQRDDASIRCRPTRAGESCQRVEIEAAHHSLISTAPDLRPTNESTWPAAPFQMGPTAHA